MCVIFFRSTCNQVFFLEASLHSYDYALPLFHNLSSR
jgi:hypothetical protein